MQAQLNPPKRPDYGLQSVAIFLTIAIFVLAGDALNGSTVQDIDDTARRLQIADLLVDGEWHDLTWPFIAMPEPYVSPWSRFVDLPYVLVTWLLTPFLGQETGFAAARAIVPLLWLGAYAWLAARLIKALLGNRPGFLQVIAAAGASLFAIIEFMPNRIDHHNVQIVLLLAACLGMVSRHQHAGALMGVSVFLSVAVGLECVPYIAVLLAGLSLHAAISNTPSIVLKLQQTGWVLLGITLPAGWVLQGPSLFQTHCDALSAPWVGGLFLAGLLSAASPSVWNALRLQSATSRIGILVIGGAMGVACLWIAFPDCHDGPYGMISDTARTYWLSNVIQEQGPVGAFARGETLLVAIFFFLLILTGSAWLSPKARQSPALVLLVAATLGTLLTAWQVRNFKFPAALLPLFLPLALEHLSEMSRKDRIRIVVSVLAPAIIGIGLLTVLVRSEGRSLTLIDYMEGDRCTDADLSRLNDLPPRRIMAPLGLSLTLSEYISAHDSPHRVGAVPFHRASPGMTSMFETFVLANGDRRTRALETFDIIAVCTLPDTGNDPLQAPVFAALSSGEDWPGLTELPLDTSSRLRLMQIDHDSVD